MDEKIDILIKNELLSTDDNTGKLRNLNNNPILNSFLANKDYEKITQTLIQLIEDENQTSSNVDVLKFYLHELGLIFNLNINEKYIKGAV